jgi:hypothetical protein
MTVPVAPSMAPPWTSVRIHRRRDIRSWRCIHRIFFHHDSRRRRDDDWPSNDNCLTDNGSRLRYNDPGRGSVLVGMCFALIA